MGKKYNTRLIKEDYSYYVEQVADLFGVDIATVRRWIRDEGLARIPKTRPHMIYSGVLKAFIEKQQAKRKKPCACHEVFCFRCQEPRMPKIGSSIATPLANGCIGFKAVCSECGGKMNRSIRSTQWGHQHPLARYLSDATAEHNGVQPMHHECSLQEEEM